MTARADLRRKKAAFEQPGFGIFRILLEPRRMNLQAPM
jgi:hypothetical protein